VSGRPEPGAVRCSSWVADVLFGRRSFTGRLPVSWPRSEFQKPVNVGDRDYDPSFRSDSV
jgi:hypothetical protein